MTLVGGREVVRNGIPDTESLIVFAAGREWIDQQWLAQVLFYGAERLGGLAGVALLHVLVVGLTVGSWMAAARLLGASARSAFLVTIPCLLAAPWSWQLRAQALALPLFVWTLWLAADHVRRPSRRILLALPLLLIWANVHGSVLLGAALVSIAVVIAGVRRARDARSIGVVAAFVLGAWACALITPYGLEIVDYYRLLLVDPPFGEAIVEWERTTPSGKTAVFYGLAALTAVLVVWQRRRVTAFELVALALLLVTALDAVRGVVWFALAVAVLLPRHVDGAIRKPDVVQYPRANTVLAGLFALGAAVAVAVVAAKPASWFEQRWPREALDAVQAAGRDARVYPSDRHADWLLWRLPELRGRVAYDVRFELLTEERFLQVARFDNELGANWKSAADRFRVVVVDEAAEPSHTADFLGDPGTKVGYRDEDVAVIVRAGA
jgi:hypothetical protein